MDKLAHAVKLPPIWARWALAIAVAVAVAGGVVIATERAGPENATSEAGAEAEANRLADVAITEDEAPHVAALVAGSEPAPALERAIAGDIRQRIGAGQLTGPLEGVTCAATGAHAGSGEEYRCTVRSAGISYPFQAVVDRQDRQLTWCKIDQPATADAGPEVPISPRCRV